MTTPIPRPRTAPGGGDTRAGGPRGGTPRDSAPRGSTPPGGASRGGGPGGGRGRRADPVRRLAYDVLIAVEQRDAYANLLLPSMLAERGLTGRDAALATELTYGTLRGRGSYDAILGMCSDRGLDRVDPPLREVLRLGTHQLLATRVRPHAAVATSVDLARDLAGQRSAGFVNAVLRRVATRDLETWMGVAAPRRDHEPLGQLAV
ncbi:MAG: transcription antitermination protein NusB, partial [Streptosporangiaceae bacterium]